MSRVLHGHQLVEVPFSFVAEEERLQLSTSAPRDLSVLVDAFKQMVLFFFLSSFYSCSWQGSWSYKSYSCKNRSGNKWNRIVC